MNFFSLALFLPILAAFAPTVAEGGTKVLAIGGSTRLHSYNDALVKQAAKIAESQGAQVTVVNLRDFAMPFYDADLEASQGLPQSAKKLRDLMIQNDVIFIASPEYNSSISAVLKNALDWASRNEEGKPSRDAFKGKIFLLMSTSPGRGGGARCLEHLKAIVQDVGGTVLPRFVTVPNAYQAFDSNGSLIDPQAKEALEAAVKNALKQ